MNQYNQTNININNDLHLVSLQTYSTLGPLLTNDLDFTDMPDLESVPLDPLIPLEPALVSEPIMDFTYDSGSANALGLTEKSLDDIKDNIEKTVNFNSLSESMEALNNPDILMNRLQQAFDTFKSQAGRSMTYLEMRQMMG